MKIQIVGPGCSRCHKTAENVEEACKALRLDAEVTKVTDITQFVKLGVMFTPGVVVNGEVVFSGKIPTLDEIKTALSQRAAL